MAEEKEPCCLVATPFILLATERALHDAGTRILKKSYWRGGKKAKGTFISQAKDMLVLKGSALLSCQ